MDVITAITHQIKHDPAMRKRMATHRRERKPCIFCGGPYAATVVYWDPAVMQTGMLFSALYNACHACLEREDFQERVAAEYAEDVAQARQIGSTRR